ncbi:hypothetical protein [Dokdonella sp.]|uniref:hypothetical protein n=1 Tax=Dokdonella sp. TaxID=2291710 RepID=UPI002F409358
MIRPTHALLLLSALALPVVGAAGQPVEALAATSPAAADCGEEAYRQLDFWIGDWDVFEADAPKGPVQARARIERVASGCAIREQYEQTDGLVGESLLAYDPVREQWQQTWITNRGSLMLISGGWNRGALVLEGETHLKDGSTVRQRITWRKHGDAVHESAMVSEDGGKTWRPAFDMIFRRHSAARR